MGKATIIEETDSGHASALGTLQAGRTAQKYPIGTVALYGPNDRTTTKIAASVIKREGAEPIVERWVTCGIYNSTHALWHRRNRD